MDTPLIFISHSAKDRDYALILEFIRREFDDVHTFVGSAAMIGRQSQLEAASVLC